MFIRRPCEHENKLTIANFIWGRVRSWSYCFTMHINFYLLTPWSRVLLEKLTGFQLFKKFPAFCGTRRFITAFTSARHLSLSWASSIQSITPHPTSRRSIYTYVSQVVSSPQVFPQKPSILLSSPPYALNAPPISFFSRFYHPNTIGWGVQIVKLLIM